MYSISVVAKPSAAFPAVLVVLAFGSGTTSPAMGAPPVARQTAAPASFAPHRAVYDLALTDAKSGSGIAYVRGRIVYELTGSACEGYAQTMRFVTQMTNQEGTSQTTDLRTSSWEQVPGKRLRFSTTTFQNEVPAAQTQGVAERNAERGPVEVKLKRPEQRDVALAGDIYFPIQHAMALVKAGAEGKHIFSADFYDGSDTGQKVFFTSAAIGHAIAPGAQRLTSLSSHDTNIDQVRSWPVQVSYFSPEAKRADTLPLYEMSFRLHENGVTSSLNIDYGDFSISGELRELSYLEVSKCK